MKIKIVSRKVHPKISSFIFFIYSETYVSCFLLCSSINNVSRNTEGQKPPLTQQTRQTRETKEMENLFELLSGRETPKPKGTWFARSQEIKPKPQQTEASDTNYFLAAEC